MDQKFTYSCLETTLVKCFMNIQKLLPNSCNLALFQTEIMQQRQGCSNFPRKKCNIFSKFFLRYSLTLLQSPQRVFLLAETFSISSKFMMIY